MMGEPCPPCQPLPVEHYRSPPMDIIVNTHTETARALIAEMETFLHQGRWHSYQSILDALNLTLMVSFFTEDGPTPDPQMASTITRIGTIMEEMVLSNPERVRPVVDIVEPLHDVIDPDRHPLAHNLMMAVLASPGVITLDGGE